MDAAGWDERYAASELVWSAGPNQFVAAELGELPPGRALDLACGEGRNAIWLAGLGWEVTAVDFSAVALDKGRRIAEQSEGGQRVEWVQADATTWQGSAYDVAVLAYLQLPAPHRGAATRAAFAALSSGGTLLVVGHDSTNLTQGTGGPQDPSVLFTADDVVNDLAGEDLEVAKAERVARTVRAEDEHRGEIERTAYDALVRLVKP